MFWKAGNQKWKWSCYSYLNVIKSHFIIMGVCISISQGDLYSCGQNNLLYIKHFKSCRLQDTTTIVKRSLLLLRYGSGCFKKMTMRMRLEYGKVSVNPRSTNNDSFGLQTHKFCWDCSQLYCCSTSSEKPEERTSTHLPPYWTVKILKTTRDLVNSTLKTESRVFGHLHEVFIVFQYGGLQRCTCTLISAHFLYNCTPFFVFCWLTVFFIT